MWICFSDSFLSVVAHKKDPSALLIRARVKGHIEAVFPDAVVFSVEKSDYEYRAVVSRQDVAGAFAVRAMDISYSDFKSSVKNKRLHDAYLAFWHIMNKLQASLLKKRPLLGRTKYLTMLDDHSYHRGTRK